MNRKTFQKVLESIQIPEGTDREKMQEILRPLNIALIQMIPERLFKYRSCSDNCISAFEKDEVWLSTSDRFNDPFDTLIKCDTDRILATMNEFAKPESFMAILEAIAKCDDIPFQVEQTLGKEYIQEIRNKAEDILSRKTNNTNHFNTQNSDSSSLLQLVLLIYALPIVLQQQSTVACFSEDVNSILMWSHYADYHRGFALGYDLREMLLPNQNGLGLFPVVYDNKRFDATSYLCYCFGLSMGLPMRNIDMMGHIKLLLYKAMEWAYELEWRLINAQPANKLGGRSEPVVIIPNSIYYGCKISEENFKKLHEIAKLKGLEEYKMKENSNDDSYKLEIAQGSVQDFV